MRVPRVGVVIKEPLGREGIGGGNDLKDSMYILPAGMAGAEAGDMGGGWQIYAGGSCL